AAVLREHVVLLPAEDVAVEVGDGLAAVRVERVGRQRHRDVVETRESGLAHVDAPGAMRTLAASFPDTRARMASSVPLSGTSVGSMSSRSGSFPEASSASDFSKPSPSYQNAPVI